MRLNTRFNCKSARKADVTNIVVINHELKLSGKDM